MTLPSGPKQRQTLEAPPGLGYLELMRQFLWGLVFGATAIYLYANYGDELHQFQRYTLEWRDWAVHTTDHYSAGREKK